MLTLFRLGLDRRLDQLHSPRLYVCEPVGLPVGRRQLGSFADEDADEELSGAARFLDRGGHESGLVRRRVYSMDRIK